MRKISLSIYSEEEIRADSLLSALFSDFSRNFIEQLCKKWAISRNGKEMNKKEKLRKKDEIIITIKPEYLDILPEDKPLEIILDEKDFLIIHKSAHLCVHPTTAIDGKNNTLVNRLLFHIKDLSTINGVMRPGIVHRLDKNTSGLMVIAKNDRAMHFFQKLFETRNITKKYLCLVSGKLKNPSGIIETEIGRSRKNRTKMTTRNPLEGRHAITEYSCIKEYGNFSLVDITLHTGRTHQIRVHMEHIGYPIVGDPTYGNKKINTLFERKYELKRQFLHAYFLEFMYQEKKYCVEIPLAKDLDFLKKII